MPIQFGLAAINFKTSAVSPTSRGALPFPLNTMRDQIDLAWASLLPKIFSKNSARKDPPDCNKGKACPPFGN